MGINYPEKDGYAGISLYSGCRGFSVCRRDEWSPMSEDDKEYLTKVHNVRLTGEELQEIISMFCRNNTTVFGDEIRKHLKSIGMFSFNN